MPQSTLPKDRFDDLPDSGRVGAHRAENPHMRGWVVLLWAALATIVLIVLGIFATLIASGRIELAPAPEPTVVETPAVEGVVDTTYDVLILNATGESGLATQLKDDVVAAGWDSDAVLASEAGSDDFPETTVYYLDAADEAAAVGLADVIGGARVEQSDVYQPSVEGEKQLTIVIGVDSTGAGASPSATPTP
ncbi:LytR C-terminal domain-containing protein [Microbacterium sp. C7(2022)]|uniref:LytR C-terminal domain-containing protein n=1 Tax=Microbacterium sp. C7(2022) TaxID=2992759 RepID=UPI00237B30BF|nr:LytR C-terminal domain-containing protein [Microbacterium sp. C7(2022)]MDE0547117.1 LytR C-terminal domain-containing protein [Microbacterium sp. C7(2022)]